MHEQFGGIYWQLPAYVSKPINDTYVRLFRDLTVGPNYGLYFIKKFDGTIEPFVTGGVVDGSINDFANIGWNEASTAMVTTAAYQIITGPPVTRQSFGGASFIQTAPNTLSITYVGPNNARLRLEMNDTHSSAVQTTLTFQIFQNGVGIPDSEFQAPTNLVRNLGQTFTFVDNVQSGDIFDIRVKSTIDPTSPVFRSLSFAATKLKQS